MDVLFKREFLRQNPTFDVKLKDPKVSWMRELYNHEKQSKQKLQLLKQKLQRRKASEAG